jgi:hypothetical protein
MMKNNYLLTESVVSTISVYLILRKLMTDFDQWDAFKLGIINKDGKKLRNPVTAKERESWDILTRLCWNIKKISYKFIGKSKFATYFTAAYLLKDSLSYFYINHNIEKLNESLQDMTCAKQQRLFETFKVLGSTETTHEDNLEVMMFKHLQEFENVVNLKELESFLFEDGEAPAGPAPTVANDIAQVSYRLGNVKKRKLKKKKEKPYEDYK